jgi:ribose transport system permease protein
MVEKLRSYGIVGVLFRLFTVLSFASPVFLSRENAANILDQNSALFILAATSTLCIITGIFDLSIAAVATASAIATVQGINAFGIIPGLLIGVFFGAFLAIVFSLCISVLRMKFYLGNKKT